MKRINFDRREKKRLQIRIFFIRKAGMVEIKTGGIENER